MANVPVGWNRPSTIADCPVRLSVNGPRIAVWIGYDPAHNPTVPNVAPTLPTDMRMGLIDTGASHSSIDADLARQLGLPVVDKKPVIGVHGAADVEVCLAQIYIPTVNFTTHGQFAMVNLRAAGQDFDCLLGRTMLRSFTLIYDGITGYCRIIN